MVEGAKSVAELLASDFVIETVVGTDVFLASHAKVLGERGVEAVAASEIELAAAGSYQTNQAALAVARMRPNQLPQIASGDYVLVLDDIRDPGNLGTIVRTADWYGIAAIIASPETADFYNPKTIAASMGSFARVQVYYAALPDFLSSRHVVYGAFLDGTDVRTTHWNTAGGCIVIGNEANGISTDVARCVSHRITIPRTGRAESLNAAIATAVVLDNLRRSL